MVSIELEQNDDLSVMRMYTEGGDSTVVPVEHYLLYAENYEGSFVRLEGDLHYKWAQKFTTKKDYQAAIGMAKGRDYDYYAVYNPKESFMVKTGVTYYKGMKPSEVSVLSFDIETTGLSPDTNKVLMISNTYRNGEKTERRLFSIDEFKSEKEMIYAWCSYVNKCDPSVLLGHNVFGFDLPFLKKRAGSLPIGKLQAKAKFAKFPSQFRKDGSQSYDYNNVLVPGREVIDTFHLAIKFDIGRSYPSYGLKAIIKHEGLERSDRQHFDAATIKDVEIGSEEWNKVKMYAEHDADDSLALFDLMVPAFFYYCQHIPKTMQQIINSATGSQVNSFMVRAYLGGGHSIPQASETRWFEGGISFGNPGIHKYVGKYDVASLYPSIILQYEIMDKHKDPNKYFLKMVKYFTEERLKNKALSAETGDRHYKDLEQAQKIVINSAYGFLGAPGLNFNSPQNAALVTKHGREILQKGIDWAEAKGWDIVNADTDSFSFKTGRAFTKNNFSEWNKELNTLYPELISWEPDGFHKKDPQPGMYKCVVVVKAKNYILKDTADNVMIKGSALKATMKEPALKKFINDVINAILEDRNDKLGSIYKDYATRCCTVDLDTIAEWCSKKTITKAVLQPKRTNEQRVWDAISSAKKSVSEGDKVYMYFKRDTELSLLEKFDGTYSQKKLLGKLFKTAEIFKSILEMGQFPNLTLKKNQGILEEMTTPTEGELQQRGQNKLPNKFKVAVSTRAAKATDKDW